MFDLNDITAFLDDYLDVATFPEAERGGVYHLPDGEQPTVRRLGLMLEPVQTLPDWIKAERLDALFLHRPWDANDLDVPIISYHLPFDERLTCGYNPRFADMLGLDGLEVLGFKRDRPIGMIADIEPVALDDLLTRLEVSFGGLEARRINEGTVRRICVVGAISEKLVREAAEQGADLYITGQLRAHAREAVAETGLNVVAIGHARSERWGLRALAGLLRERFAGLEIISW